MSETAALRKWYDEAEGDLRRIHDLIEEAWTERRNMANEFENDVSSARYHRCVARGLSEALAIVRDVLEHPGGSA